MTPGQFAALLGFLFTAAWIGFGFGEAILCLVGAGVFAGLLYAGEGFLRASSRAVSDPPNTTVRPECCPLGRSSQTR